MRKRKTLPKNFDDLLKTASLDELKAVFDACELDARGGYGKVTAIGFIDCPDALISWLVGQGLDVDAADSYGRSPLWERCWFGREAQLPLLLSLGANIEQRDTEGCTPLHAAAGKQKPSTVKALLNHGASFNALDKRAKSPLLRGLEHTQNLDIPGMAEVAKLLLTAGETITPEMRERVEAIGKNFEFHRSKFNPDYLPQTDAALNELYRIFAVAATPHRVMHDGVSPIIVPAGSFQEQHQILWELLVPSSGPAKTVQGELIRLAGRIAIEIRENGAVNWDRDFKAMLASIPVHLRSGTPLPAKALSEACTIASDLRDGDGEDEQIYRLAELSVEWVKNNPSPMPLTTTDYKR